MTGAIVIISFVEIHNGPSKWGWREYIIDLETITPFFIAKTQSADRVLRQLPRSVTPLHHTSICRGSHHTGPKLNLIKNCTLLFLVQEDVSSSTHKVKLDFIRLSP